MERLKFELNYIPIAKSNSVKIWKGRFRYSQKDAAEIEKLIWDIKLQLPKRFKPIKKSVLLTCYFILPNKVRRDLDNILKTLQDAMTKAGVFEDDSLIFKHSAEKIIIPKYQKTIIYIQEYQQSEEIKREVEGLSPENLVKPIKRKRK